MTHIGARIVLVFALVTAIFIIGVSIALAHSWYPAACCNLVDCYPEKAENVRMAPGGWLLHDGTFIAARDARPSPDGLFHVCRQGGRKDGALMKENGKVPCFWAPVQGS